MKIVNDSTRVVRAYAYSGFPHTQENLAAAFGDLAQGASVTRDLNPGDYYAVITTTNIGPIRPGLVIAASGGVPSENVVTLTETDRISIR